MAFEQTSTDSVSPQDFIYGKTNYGKVAGGTAAVGAGIIMAVPCGNLTGIKAFYIYALTNALDFVIYASYDISALQAGVEALTLAELEVLQVSTTIDAAGTRANIYTTTKPVAWLVVDAIRNGGSDATYNAYFAGN